MQLILGVRGILKFLLMSLIIGILIGNFARDHWTAIMLYTPFWIIPIWGYMVPVGLFSVWLLFFTGGHHE